MSPSTLSIWSKDRRGAVDVVAIVSCNDCKARVIRAPEVVFPPWPLPLHADEALPRAPPQTESREKSVEARIRRAAAKLERESARELRAKVTALQLEGFGFNLARRTRRVLGRSTADETCEVALLSAV